MKLSNLVKYLEDSVPLSYQESYDNSGLQIGGMNCEINTALLSLDVTENVIDEALEKGCDIIITHHPLIFGGLKRISDGNDIGRLVLKAIENNISIYSMHTNLDIIKGGVSYRMAEKLGLKNIIPLVPLEGHLLKLAVFVPLDYADKVRKALFDAGAGNIGDYDRCSYNIEGYGTFRAGPGTDPFAGEQNSEHTEKEVRVESVLPAYLKSRVIKSMIEAHPYEEVAFDIFKIENAMPGAGLGCVGDLKEAVEEKTLLTRLSELFNAKGIRHTALRGNKVRRVAVMGGSGSNYTGMASSSGADAYITADIKYHSFFEGRSGMLIADIGHYESELPALEIINELITKKFPKFAVRFSEINTNPVNYLQAWKK